MTEVLSALHSCKSHTVSKKKKKKTTLKASCHSLCSCIKEMKYMDGRNGKYINTTSVTELV